MPPDGARRVKRIGWSASGVAPNGAHRAERTEWSVLNGVRRMECAEQSVPSTLRDVDAGRVGEC
ncbi:hypothetical protein GCM10009828_042350 [Actinoplanes couchii]|uniref:Uncharacterized protein n=1 Tax=Actinoplanes couchii TaxID=403638 RepID=A0ABQ3XD51_9ACTN|nr:hypothetical protein Aco03nite_048080 [Actinoplanes couchii]